MGARYGAGREGLQARRNEQEALERLKGEARTVRHVEARQRVQQRRLAKEVARDARAPAQIQHLQRRVSVSE